MPETQSDDAVIRASIKMNTLLLLGKVVASNDCYLTTSQCLKTSSASACGGSMGDATPRASDSILKENHARS